MQTALELFRNDSMVSGPVSSGNRFTLSGGRLLPVADDPEIRNSFVIQEFPADKPQPNVEQQALLYNEYIRLWPLLHAYYSDPLSSLAASRTMLLPHQVEAALRVIESVNPRFLIADEVGLGKTIEAGLIIKELILKYNFERVLICVPSPLLNQWQTELQTKFNEDFTVITGDMLRKHPDVLLRKNKVLISVDLAKDAKYRNYFLRQPYDIIVFDEAHRLRRDLNKVTKAYAFAEAVSRNTRALLLLSATPFRGKLEEIYYLVQLLDPDILGPVHSFMAKFGSEGHSDLRHKLQPVVVRRRKVDVGGFTKRIARTVKLSMSPAERAFYEATTEYVKREYNRAMAQGQRMRGFVMITFQKLLDSSAVALLSALAKRKARLEETYFRSLGGGNPLSIRREAGRDLALEFLRETAGDEQETEEFLEDEDVGNLEVIFEPAEVLLEIQALTKLIELGSRIDRENKLLVLVKTIKEMQRSGHRRFLIFTQFKSTLFHLQKELSPQFRTGIFHGSMNNREKEDAVAEFYREGGSEILILTEAGGEGRNLQIASALFNYDLPWSPLKIEQRIGRIHRFGQKRDVHIVNFATRDTVAERVLEVLENKIRIFEDALGESDILLGILEDELRFSENFNLFMNEKKNKKEIESELMRSLDLARASISKIDRLFSPEFMDFNMRAFMAAAREDGSAADPKREKNLAELLLQVARKTGFPMEKKSQDIISFFDGSSRIGTFSHILAEEQNNLEYLAFGHPTVDRLVGRLIDLTESTAVVEASCSGRDGWLLLFDVTISADKKYRRIYPVHLSAGKAELLTVETIPPLEYLQCTQKSWREFAGIIEEAIGFLWEQIERDKEKILGRIASGVDFWRTTVAESHCLRSSELNEKLEVQRGKMKWYGEKNMAAAIKRTINQKNEEELRAGARIRDLRRNMATQVAVRIRHVCRLIG